MNAQPTLLPKTTLLPTSRRSFLRRAGLASAVAAIAPGAAAYLAGKPAAKAAPLDNIDAAVLNFALQTEYLGASYYAYAASGGGIAANGGSESGNLGTQGTVTVRDNPAVHFYNPLIQQFANELAEDELGHVAFLQAGLASSGYPVTAMPNIDLVASFNELAKAAGIESPFDPLKNETNFLIGAFIFDDTDITAYTGAATMITSPGYLAAASGILSVEAYHAGAIRTHLFLRSQEPDSTKKYGIDIAMTIEKISNLKNRLSNGTTSPSGAPILGATSSEGIVMDGSANITAVDSNSLAFERNPRQILNILYGGQERASGLFFPSGLNGFPGFK